jgi:hypothetical protein
VCARHVSHLKGEGCTCALALGKVQCSLFGILLVTPLLWRLGRGAAFSCQIYPPSSAAAVNDCLSRTHFEDHRPGSRAKADRLAPEENPKVRSPDPAVEFRIAGPNGDGECKALVRHHARLLPSEPSVFNATKVYSDRAADIVMQSSAQSADVPPYQRSSFDTAGTMNLERCE